MPNPDIGESTLKAQLRLIDVYNNHLGGELNNFASSDFPLPDPEVYVEEPPDEYEDVFRNLNVDEAACIVAPFRPTEATVEFTGDGTQYGREQDLQLLAQTVLRPRAGYEAPQVRGRKLTEREWLRRRGEKYKGAMLHAATKHAEDGTAIEDIMVDAHDAELEPSPEFGGKLTLASVLFGVSQEVLVPTQ